MHPSKALFATYTQKLYKKKPIFLKETQIGELRRN